MAKPKIKHYRYLAIIVILALILPTFQIVQGVVADGKQSKVQTANTLSKSDEETVNEISNLTGVKSEEIIKLRHGGMTWNQILDKLKNASNKDKIAAFQQRSNQILKAGLDLEYVKKLNNEGFENNRIIETKSLVDRVTSELKQILDSDKQSPATTTAAGSELSDVGKQDIEAYKELLDKIDLKTAIHLMLKLEKDFGSIEKVMDEYLLSLQLGIDLNLCIKDRKAYEDQKREKSSKLDINKLITLQSIESKLLELTQNKGTSSNLMKDVPDKKPEINSGVNKTDINKDLPASPLPDVRNPMPQNPQDDVMKEINALKNKSLN